jgi:hypothetical protein
MIMMISQRRPPRRHAASAGLVRACCPAPARIYGTLLRYLQWNLDSPSAKKCSGTTEGWLQKKRDRFGYFAPFRCSVGSDQAPPPGRRWSIRTTLERGPIRSNVMFQTTVSNAQHSLERECRDETRVSLSHNRRLPAASVSGRSVGCRSAHQTCPKSHDRTARL